MKLKDRLDFILEDLPISVRVKVAALVYDLAIIALERSSNPEVKQLVEELSRSTLQ